MNKSFSLIIILILIAIATVFYIFRTSAKIENSKKDSITKIQSSVPDSLPNTKANKDIKNSNSKVTVTYLPVSIPKK